MKSVRLGLSIRAKMLLVSCVLFAIPWIAYRYAGELERILRENQETAVLNTARAIATALNDRPSLFHTPARDAGIDASNAIVAYKLPQPIALDGRLDEWLRQGVELRALGREHVIEQAEDTEVAPVTLWHAVGVYDNHVYAAFEVIDEDLVYRDPKSLRVDTADHVRIGVFTPWGELRRYIVSARAAGPVTAVQVPTDASGLAKAHPEPRIQGFWQETASGFNLELRLPRAMVGPRLGFAFADVDDAQTRRIRSIVGSVGPEGRESLGTAMVPPPEAVQIVRSLSRPGTRVWIIAADRQLVARSGSLRTTAEAPSRPGVGQGWFARAEAMLRPLYRYVIPPAPTLAVEPDLYAALYPGAEADEALSGRVASGRRRIENSPIEVLATAHPVWTDERVVGAVVVEETTQGVLAVRQRLIERLLSLALGSFLLVGLALFVFATRLVSRIRRLRDEAEQAIDSAGRLRAVTASSAAHDELGDLSRSFSNALERLAQYTQYLESLATRLSHELRTPITVVRSSLDNLKLHGLPAEADVYVTRAEQGLARLATIITRMTEATRLERMMRDSERERFDLRAVVTGCVEGYRIAYAPKRFALIAPAEPVLLTGVPDLIAQMLDKLAANAVDFARGDHPIEIELRVTAQEATLAVRNIGPRLPAEIRERLFHSMASVRPHSGGDEPHLGLGLYIVHLIADFHHGKAIARDRADAEGVEVLVRLPRLVSDPG
ncbi:MAG: proteobacterial dedicated sortase system histidine kinase [Betaproteobacteria bacterium]|nr:MAG: proteobacterial dedicated sortase system histidine kinase [Betaproteobacteria bacterium]